MPEQEKQNQEIKEDLIIPIEYTETPNLDKMFQDDISTHLTEEADYLKDVLTEYERYVNNIGNLKYTASLLLYYRDEIQESLNYLKYQNIDIKEHWRKVVYLDNILRAKIKEFVYEVGYDNFKQYQIINDPPKLHWWWYLNKQVSAPKKEKSWWEFWKR